MKKAITHLKKADPVLAGIIRAPTTYSPRTNLKGALAQRDQVLARMAKLDKLGYSSPRELLAERFHIDEKLLEALNPDADFAKAADLGVTSAAIADTLHIATAGDYDQSLPKLNLTQRQVPIVVKLPPAARQAATILRVSSTWARWRRR